MSAERPIDEAIVVGTPVPEGDNFGRMDQPMRRGDQLPPPVYFVSGSVMIGPRPQLTEGEQRALDSAIENINFHRS